MKNVELITRAAAHKDAVAFKSGDGVWTYRQLLDRSAAFAGALLNGDADLNESRVAFLIPGGFEYAATQWGIWRAGGVAVPLCLSATPPEWEYALTDAEISTVVVAEDWREKIEPLCAKHGIRLLESNEIGSGNGGALPDVSAERRAMILYTSGTTSRPKGVVTTHANIRAQVESLVEAWEWRASDRIPLFLPMHHIHGIINVLSCALWTGAVIEPFPKFDMGAVLERVKADAYTVFMAVPTIYVKLIQAIESMPDEERGAVAAAVRDLAPLSMAAE